MDNKIEITKQDWKELKHNVEQLLKNSIMATMQYEYALNVCIDKLAEFPEDNILEDITKEIIEEKK